MSNPPPQSAKLILGISLLFWLLLVAIGWWVVRSASTSSEARMIPKRFSVELPDACLQAMVTRVNKDTDHSGFLQLLERNDAREPWRLVGEAMPVSMGRNGIAWGTGEHTTSAPPNFRIKHEGDGCSPAGIFRIPFAFGYAASAPALKLKYVAVTNSTTGVDDMGSAFYNQVVDAGSVPVDWQSRETMLREDGVYRWGAFIANNPKNVPGDGSCIFMHLWHGPGVGTAGCTAMTETNLLRVLQWLDPAKEPRLIQGLAAW